MSKDYVTIKIPRKTRDQARDDPRTYEAIMQAGLGGDVGDLEPYGGEVPERTLADDQVSDILEIVQDIWGATHPIEANELDEDRLYARLEELETNLKNEIEALQGGRV